MDILLGKLRFLVADLLFNGILIIILSFGTSDSSAALNNRLPFCLNSSSFNSTIQIGGFIRGRITQPASNTPICYADISNGDNTLFTKSNSRGEFILGPIEFPATLRIRKFGFKEETIIVKNPVDSFLISLTPLQVQRIYSSNKVHLHYELIFKKAIEKLRAKYDPGSPDQSERELVYCRFSSATDSKLNSLFESFAYMNVSKGSLQDYQPCISRYASIDDYIPGLAGNRLEFNIDPYVNLPFLVERFITRKGYIIQEGRQIAMVQIDLENTSNTYYINIADTSILHIISQFKWGNRKRIPISQTVRQSNKTISSEISFSYSRDNYLIDWLSMNEEFILTQKNKSIQTISDHTLFAIVPESSKINDAVRDQVSQEVLTEIRQQINFKANYSFSDKSSAFDSEAEKLLLKPYRSTFWAQNSIVMPDFNEQTQIIKWENDSLFYSENRRTPEKGMIGADSLVIFMNNNLIAIENVYVETDRPDYLAGDTIWFSAFVLNNLQMDSTLISKILYVDLINADNQPEKHLKLFIRDGRCYGDFILEKDSENGIYRIRAYTQYMRNFQNDYLFEKDIIVHQSDFNNMILVNAVIIKSKTGDSIELSIKTILPDKYLDEDTRLEAFAKLNDTMSVKKIFIFKRSLNGSMGFFVPSSLSCQFVDIRFVLSGRNVISEQRLSIPLKSGINLQFFPESGKMVDGINTVIAYKAIDNRGYPAEFSAVITDENNNIIKHFSGDDSGIGKFEFMPEYSHSYKALVAMWGNKYSFNLPDVEPTGYVLNFNSDSSDIIIKNNQNSHKNKHYLLISARGAVHTWIETIPENKPQKVHLPLKRFPKGIVQITLFDSLFRPLAERLVFNNRSDQKMIINIETDKKTYRQREKVTLTLNVTDATGNPVRSSLALTVVDAVRSDSLLISSDIESYLYLTSELKGGIDFRRLNLSDTSSDGNTRRDLLMMTQGWRNYLWNSIRYTNTLKILYPIERGFSIQGTVYSYNNRWSRGSVKLNYFDFNSGFNGVTEIDESNRFKIEIPIFYNSHLYFIQNMNNYGRIKNLGLSIDTIPIPVVGYRMNELPFLSYKPGYVKDIEKLFSEFESAGGQDLKYIKLPEVKVTARSDRSGYSSPDITFDLEKKDPTGKKYSSLFQMISEEFGEKAFIATGYGTKGKVYNPILVVDGAPMTASECPPCYDPYTYDWAASIPVNEISDVKFYGAGSNYSQWLTPPPSSAIKWKTDVMGNGLFILPPDPKIYLPIVSFKTYSNSFRGNPRGAVLFPFQGIYMAREFYQPDYEHQNIQAPDNRATIFWDPDIKTDSTGTVKVTFYNSDLKGKAQIRISGVSFYLKDSSTAFTHYSSY